jgi:hypothetical protein
MSHFWGVSPQAAIYTGDADGVDAEFFVRGWGGINYPMDGFDLNGGIKANIWLTQGDAGGDQANFGVFGGGSTAAGPGTLGASLTIPLSGDWSDFVSAAIVVDYSLPLD